MTSAASAPARPTTIQSGTAASPASEKGVVKMRGSGFQDGPVAVSSSRWASSQRQSVAVAKAVMWNSRVVILDEPTAALGVAQTRQVLNLVRRLAERGLGVAIVTHNLHDVFEAADRITVLRLGQRVALFKTADTNQQEVVHAITAGTVDRVPGMEAAAEVEA
jgi:ABC-type sugar transport system ATPase subunit